MRIWRQYENPVLVRLGWHRKQTCLDGCASSGLFEPLAEPESAPSGLVAGVFCESDRSVEADGAQGWGCYVAEQNIDGLSVQWGRFQNVVSAVKDQKEKVTMMDGGDGGGRLN